MTLPRPEQPATAAEWYVCPVDKGHRHPCPPAAAALPDVEGADPHPWNDVDDRSFATDSKECPMCGGQGHIYNITEAVQAAIEAGSVALAPVPASPPLDFGEQWNAKGDDFTRSITRAALAAALPEGVLVTAERLARAIAVVGEGGGDVGPSDAAAILAELERGRG